jgi:hypothetical protein
MTAVDTRGYLGLPPLPPMADVFARVKAQQEREALLRDPKIVYHPDSPVVERSVAALLERLRPEVLECSDAYCVVTPRGWDLLPEYSASYPTGQADGKVWKVDTWFGAPGEVLERFRKVDPKEEQRWRLREYVDRGLPDRMSIHDRFLTVRTR